MKSGKNYAAWEISETDFPKDGSIEEKIAFFVRYGILAPSTHNIQPWKFQIEENVLKIYPDQKYSLPQTDPTKRGLFVSLGACTTNIIVAASHFMYNATVQYSGTTEKDFVITLQFKEMKKKEAQLSPLFPSVVKRYSNKLAYSSQRIERELLARLEDSSVGDAQIKIVDDHEKVAYIASLHKKALVELMTPRVFRAEIAKWLRYNNTKLYDGMPGFVVGLPTFLSLLVKRIFPLAPSLPKKMANSDFRLITSSPAVGVIITKNSDIASFVDVGRAYELVALKATGKSIHTTPMAAVIENKQYTPLVAVLFGIKSETLQFFFRLGYSNTSPYHTPRIPLAKVLS
jgi:hypothetical protein